jgi:hypothetical protein
MRGSRTISLEFFFLLVRFSLSFLTALESQLSDNSLDGNWNGNGQILHRNSARPSLLDEERLLGPLAPALGTARAAG